jgi:hypothetical protein
MVEYAVSSSLRPQPFLTTVMSWWRQITQSTRHSLRAIRKGVTPRRKHSGHDLAQTADHDHDPAQTSDQSTQRSVANSGRRRVGHVVTHIWNTVHPSVQTDLTEVFVAYETIRPQTASDAIENGEYVLRLVASTGATLTVTETDEGQYLCRYETSLPWLTRSKPEYYHLSPRSWIELEDTLVPLLALGWDLDESTADGEEQRSTDRKERATRESESR